MWPRSAGRRPWCSEPHRIDPPLVMYSVLPLSLFTFKLAKLVHLYRVRVGANFRQTVAAAVAGLALTHTIGRAVVKGLFTRSEPFFRTPKDGESARLLHALAAAREESLMMLGLWLAAWGVAHSRLQVGQQGTGPVSVDRRADDSVGAVASRRCWHLSRALSHCRRDCWESAIAAWPSRDTGRRRTRPVDRRRQRAGRAGERRGQSRAPRAHPGRLRAIVSMLLAVAAFSGMDAMLKLFAQHYPPMEVAFLRGLASLPFMALPALLRGRYQDLKPQRIWMHVLRGVLMVVMLGAFIYSVRTLSLASAYSIFLAEPLIVTALAAPLLGDRVGWRNWHRYFGGTRRGGRHIATVGVESRDAWCSRRARGGHRLRAEHDCI